MHFPLLGSDKTGEGLKEEAADDPTRRNFTEAVCSRKGQNTLLWWGSASCRVSKLQGQVWLPCPGPRCLCACVWLGNFCLLPQSSSLKRGKHNCDKCSEHWPTWVEQLDTSTKCGILGEDFQTECTQKLPPLACPLAPDFGGLL